MSTIYNGQPALVTAASALNIASSTNATPVVVTTSTAHGLTDGDLVQIVSHFTNTAANGIRKIVKLTSTTFELYDPTAGTAIVGTGVGGATGTATPYTSSTFALPADSDPPAAATWNPALQTIADRSAYAVARLGRSLVRAQAAGNYTDDDTNAAWTGSTSYATTTWTAVTNVNAFIAPAGEVHVVAGDEIEVDFATSVLVAAGNFGFGLFVHVYDYGTSPSFGSSSKLPGSVASIGALGVVAPLRLRWKGSIEYPAPGLTRGKGIRFFVGAYNRGGGAAVADFYGDHQYTAQVWR
jgi:hypothetical protein